MTFHAVSHSTAQSVAVTGGTWLVAIVAAVLAAWFRWIVPIAIFLLYLLLHHGQGFINVSSSSAPWVIVIVIGGFVGWQLGGRTIFRHLGEREYRTRIGYVKGISSIWGYWFGDKD